MSKKFTEVQIEDVINSEYNNISVWDITFYRHDDDGNPLEDKNGKTIIYTSYKVDCSYLTDVLEVDDLVPDPYHQRLAFGKDKANE